MIRICCITYKDLDVLVRQAADRVNDPGLHISIMEGLRDGFLHGVQKEITDGAEVMLSGGANYAVAEQHFQIPVLEFKISEFDYLAAIHSGYELGKKTVLIYPGVESIMETIYDAKIMAREIHRIREQNQYARQREWRSGR